MIIECRFNYEKNSDICITVSFLQENEIKRHIVKGKIYGYLGLHCRAYEEIDPPYNFCVTHLKSGLKLPFYGTKKQLKEFCEKYGENNELWEDPLEHIDDIKLAWKSIES
jgi:hypothetical protein